jgi:hypothetical protein
VALVKWLILKKQGSVDAALVSVVFTFARAANLIPAMYPLRPIRPIRPILPLFSGRRRPRPNGPYSLIAQPNGLGGAAPQGGGLDNARFLLITKMLPLMAVESVPFVP